MKDSKVRLSVKNGSNGLDLYMTVDGTAHYVTTRRRSGYMWQQLKDGITLGELRRVKPKKNKLSQKYFNSVNHLIKVADDFIKYELAA